MRTQLNLNRCVGITKSGELIMVDYIFSHGEMNGAPFHGVTGTRFQPISQDDIDNGNDPDTVRECYELDYHWKEAVASGQTELSLEDYVERVIAECDGDYFGHDTSSIQYIPDVIKKMHFDGYETFTCVGGGRMFPIEEEMLLILDQDLWDAVNACEAEELPLEMIQSLVGGELVVQGE